MAGRPRNNAMTQIQFCNAGQVLFGKADHGKNSWHWQLAQMLGTSRANVYNYAHGRRGVPQDVAQKIAAALAAKRKPRKAA